MNDIEAQRKVIIMSLSSLLVGSLLFVFGVSFSDSILPMVVNYAIAILLYTTAFLAVYKQHQKDKQMIYKYILCLSVFLTVLITAVTISQFS